MGIDEHLNPLTTGRPFSGRNGGNFVNVDEWGVDNKRVSTERMWGIVIGLGWDKRWFIVSCNADSVVIYTLGLLKMGTDIIERRAINGERAY